MLGEKYVDPVRREVLLPLTQSQTDVKKCSKSKRKNVKEVHWLFMIVSFITTFLIPLCLFFPFSPPSAS